MSFRRTSFGPDYRYAERDARPQLPQAAPASIRPVDRIIIIPKTDQVLADLLRHRVHIKPVGSDWHIIAQQQDQFARVLSLLKVKGVHGVLKRMHPSVEAP